MTHSDGLQAVDGHRAIVSQNAPPSFHLLAKANRNDLCPCGSGRKVKQCHGRQQILRHQQPPRRPLPKPQQRSDVILQMAESG